MQMREKMHSESGEAERRGVREGEGLAGCVWLSNKDFRRTSWKHRLYRKRSVGVNERWGPKHRWKDTRLTQLDRKKKGESNGLGQRKRSDKGKLTFSGWLYRQQFEAVPDSWFTYMIAAPHLLPPTHRISYTHIHKGAAKLMLMWLLGCTCAALTLSSIEQMDELWEVGVNFPPPTTAPVRQHVLLCRSTWVHMHVLVKQCSFIPFGLT